MAFYARRSRDGLVSQLWHDFKMTAGAARFMGKLPVLVSGLYGVIARKRGDLHNFSLNKYNPW